VPLGILEDRVWGREAVQLAPGDALVLYTDGITEAQNEQGVFYGEDRLLESAKASLGCPAEGIRDAIVADVHRFVGDAPQFDDIALAVVVRDSLATAP
jgi:sigma-B regulation protein RsbU (phosphoserine phosphatase)